jgi:hypothetical protein
VRRVQVDSLIEAKLTWRSTIARGNAGRHFGARRWLWWNLCDRYTGAASCCVCCLGIVCCGNARRVRPQRNLIRHRRRAIGDTAASRQRGHGRHHPNKHFRIMANSGGQCKARR